MDCYRCGQQGHFAADCALSMRASSDEEHRARIDGFVRDWTEGRISMERKRMAVSDENKLWYGPACRRALTWPPG